MLGRRRPGLERELFVLAFIHPIGCRVDPRTTARAELFVFGHHRSAVVAHVPRQNASSGRFTPGGYCATVVAMFVVRQTEGWTPGSITSGIVLAALALAGLVWVIDRASRR
jgi:hypothetical protein